MHVFLCVWDMHVYFGRGCYSKHGYTSRPSTKTLERGLTATIMGVAATAGEASWGRAVEKVDSIRLLTLAHIWERIHGALAVTCPPCISILFRQINHSWKPKGNQD